MQNRISYHILSLLHLNGSVKIPGLGRFRQAHRHAVLNAESERLIPPQTETTFISGESMAGSLLEKYVAYRTDQSRTKARKEILAFSHEVQESLRTGRSAYLSYIGQLESGHTDLQFDPENEFLNPGISLPEVGFVPREGFAFQTEPHEPVKDEPISVLPPLTFSTREAEEIHSRSEDKASETRTESPKTETLTPVPVSTPATLPVRPKRPSGIPVPPPAKKEREWLGPVIALCLLAIIACAFLLFTGGSERSAKSAEKSADQTGSIGEEMTPENQSDTGGETKVVHADSGYKTDAVTQTPEQGSDPQETDEAVPPAQPAPEQIDASPAVGNKECMIVVGAFSLTLNADRMSRELEELGYEVRSVQNGKLAQVGVPVSCEDSALETLRDRLRGSVEPSAWVLRPE